MMLVILRILLAPLRLVQLMYQALKYITTNQKNTERCRKYPDIIGAKQTRLMINIVRCIMSRFIKIIEKQMIHSCLGSLWSNVRMGVLSNVLDEPSIIEKSITWKSQRAVGVPKANVPFYSPHWPTLYLNRCSYFRKYYASQMGNAYVYSCPPRAV